MPTRPPGPCTAPQCHALALPGSGRCVEHQREAWSGSDRRTRLPSDWGARRAQVLKRDGYMCQLRSQGCTGLATEVDHRTPGDDHGLTNLQAVCRACHARKTAREGADARAQRSPGVG